MPYRIAGRLEALVALLVAVSLGAASTACDPSESDVEYQDRQEYEDPVEVTNISLGSDLDSRDQIGEPTDTFHPNDDVFVSVSLRGTANDVWMTARWFHERDEIHVTRHRINLADEETTALSYRTPDAMPTGRYTVEIRVNDVVLGAEQFQVVAPE